ncbi:unnamed protein product [Effrenium voratum]|uniref:Uncharacterized protein n=1 Tax=Effrenium voratum TaxID=2562239 RepID=A0AA36HM65_9DINO|nr:unnamed protein product [Effrenium voratum]
MLASCNQAFAWCMYFGCKWMLATREFQDASEDKMLLQLELATLVSLLAFFAIWVLDKLADLDATGDEVDHAIIQVIGGFSILVGFAWEQCFDRAIEVIAADQQRYNLVPPMITKLVLAAACICIIIPAWRKWILPMVLREGWRFGFVIDGSDARWRKVFKSKRWHWLMHRYGIQTVGFKKPSMKEAAMKREKNPGHAFQKRRNEKGLFKILQRERILQIGCDEENMLSPNARTGNRPTLMYGNGGLASPLLQKNHPELGAVKEAISALKKQLQQLSEEERCDATHYRQQMGSLSEEIAKLSTWTAELGLGL